MRGFRDVHWHLLPGNHDPHRAEGVPSGMRLEFELANSPGT
jgi:hypothetical protein